MSAPSRARAWMCVSSRRRPITSPPGGGTIARPQRASSGPASRTEARIREQSSSSSSVFVSSAAWIRTSFGPIHSASAPRSAISSTIVSTSRIRGTFRKTTGSGLSMQPARIGSAPFLFPAARIVPLSDRAPSITNDSARASVTAVDMAPQAIVVAPVEPTRDRAWETLTRYTKSEALRRHALAVEASMRAYARVYGEDEERWAVVALLHDFDYEIHPSLDQHPQDGAPILREEGWPEDVIEAVLSHAEHLSLPRDTLLKKALFAWHELVQARKPGAETLLDVACGTGAHLAELRRWYRCEGLDLDGELLAVARERLRDVPLHQDDMRDFDLGRRFDAVTCLFSSIGYVLTVEGLTAAVAAMARHLEPGGVLVVEPWLA